MLTLADSKQPVFAADSAGVAAYVRLGYPAPSQAVCSEYPRENEGRCRAAPLASDVLLASMRISMPSTVRRCDRPRRLPSFAAIAGVTGVLTAGLIRDNLQAHLAPAPVGEQPPSSTPASLPVRSDRGGPTRRL